ncbi:MAG: hypothetical protein QM811_23580 [Pirellulales bacterium]
MFTSFQDAVKKSPTIVVAKMTSAPDPKTSTVMIDVAQVLKGTMGLGRHKVAFGAYPNVDVKAEEIVVFLDQDLSWNYVAVPLHGQKTVEKSVLALRGFYDFNAHIIDPGLITLDLLKGYLKDGTLIYRFRGNIFFPQLGKSDWKPSAIQITGRYDAVNEEVDVSGLPALVDFPKQPKIHVSSFNSPSGNFDLEYSRSRLRQLELTGFVASLDDKTCELIIRFAVSGPEIPTEAAFRDYLSDGRKRGITSKFELPCVMEDGQKRVLFLEKGRCIDSGQEEMRLLGWDREPSKVLAMECHSPNGNVSIGHQDYIGPSPLPEIVDRELDRKDGIHRLVAKTESGEFVILALKFDGTLVPSGLFVWAFQDILPNLLYTRKAAGTIYVTKGDELRMLGTFVPEFASLGFSEKE